MKNLFRSAALFGAISLIAASCFKTEVAVVVENDQSATFDLLVAYNADQIVSLAQLSGEGDSITREQICSELLEDTISDNSSVDGEAEAYEEGDFCGFRFKTEIEPSDNLSEALESAAAEGGEGVTGSDQSFDLEKIADDEWNFKLDLGQSTSEAVGEAGGFGDLGGLGSLADGFLDDIEINYSVTLPGEDVENNATTFSSVGDSTKYEWSLGLDSDLEVLEAKTQPGSGFSITSLWPFPGALLLFLVPVGLVVFLILRNKEDEPAPINYSESQGLSTQQEFQVHDSPSSQINEPPADPPVL